MGDGVCFSTVMLQARACEGAGGKPAFSPQCFEHSSAASLPFTAAPHSAGMGCATSTAGTGFADMSWGIPAPWTVLPKRRKSLTQPQGGRQAAICDRDVHAQQGGEGSCSPRLFAPSPPTHGRIVPGATMGPGGGLQHPLPKRLIVTKRRCCLGNT